jgi:hypothetical protein
MREQPHYTDLLTKEFFEEHYVSKEMSFPAIRKMLLDEGKNISIFALHKYAKRLGIGRTRSEAKRQLDWTTSFLNEDVLEALDGFLLGDGHIQEEKEHGRLSCGLEYEEFCLFLMGHFMSYKPLVKNYKDDSMSKGIRWQGQTKNHPDFYPQCKRWYTLDSKGRRVKKVPKDVRITPKSMMLWYLGDGSVVNDTDSNTVVVRFATDGFVPEDNEYLVGLLNQIGVSCHRTADNRIQIKANGIPAFFKFIGEKSPVKCYQYKFDIPGWRFEAIRMRQVAKDLDIDYHRLAYLVKIGKVPCLRASGKGKPRFLSEHVEVCKKLIESGELY